MNPSALGGAASSFITPVTILFWLRADGSWLTSAFYALF
jgi:hypothetical protein